MTAETEGFKVVRTYDNGGFMEVPLFMADRFLEQIPEVKVPNGRSEVWKHEITAFEMEELNRT